MIERERFRLVKRDKHPGEESLVLFLQGQGEAVDDRTKNLEQLRNTVVPFGLVNKLEENVVDGSSDEGSKIEEFTVDTVQRGLQEIPFPGVFTVEKLEELK
jgi:hypothetical protein